MLQDNIYKTLLICRCILTTACSENMAKTVFLQKDNLNNFSLVLQLKRNHKWFKDFADTLEIKEFGGDACSWSQWWWWGPKIIHIKLMKSSISIYANGMADYFNEYSPLWWGVIFTSISNDKIDSRGSIIIQNDSLSQHSKKSRTKAHVAS